MSLVLPDLPEDFDDFWAAAKKEADSVRLDFRRGRAKAEAPPGTSVDLIDFLSVGGRTLHGWFARPAEPGHAPAFLWIPPYGRASVLPNEYGTRPGFASLSFNFHGLDAFHEEVYSPTAGYFADGAGDPRTWVFRRMTQDCLVALRVLQAQLEVDEQRIGAMGMSQGGGLAIACGAHSPIARAVCADMPFLAGIRATLLKPVYRYPLKELVDFMEGEPLGRERIFHTLSYFDTVNQAARCSVPTRVSLGLKDPASRPDSVRSVFEALPGRKELAELDWGHDWHPAMIGSNQRWFETSWST